MTQIVGQQRLKVGERVFSCGGLLASTEGMVGVIKEIHTLGPGQAQALVLWEDGGVARIMTKNLKRLETNLK
jgi:hypothetical protein